MGGTPVPSVLFKCNKETPKWKGKKGTIGDLVYESAGYSYPIWPPSQTFFDHGKLDNPTTQKRLCGIEEATALSPRASGLQTDGCHGPRHNQSMYPVIDYLVFWYRNCSVRFLVTWTLSEEI